MRAQRAVGFNLQPTDNIKAGVVTARHDTARHGSGKITTLFPYDHYCVH
jgi:hypothetical protein